MTLQGAKARCFRTRVVVYAGLHKIIGARSMFGFGFPFSKAYHFVGIGI